LIRMHDLRYQSVTICVVIPCGRMLQAVKTIKYIM